MNIRLDGKRALVTGGNSGIGAAVVNELANAGAKVCINYVHHEDIAQEMVNGLIKQGKQACSFVADVSDPASVKDMFTYVDKTWGGIDILVNNAGIDGVKADAWEAQIADWQAVIAINLYGSFYCAQQALQRMVRQKSGVVINMSSVHEEIAWTGHSAYTASKAALSMLTKTLAQEAAPFGIRVVSLAPGAVKTDINQNVWSSESGLHDLLTKIPLGHIGTPQDIARMAVVLASDAACYVTGRTTFVDGGMTDYPDFAHGG
jgi:glucose 1-dehydrogenase